ncbi:Uncharacterised protein [Mycobacteroides abscessus subsp. massiliense]|nr:Uncharacterised protein [Mycobacteroides abscessus subsp. massiliense]
MHRVQPAPLSSRQPPIIPTGQSLLVGLAGRLSRRHPLPLDCFLVPATHPNPLKSFALGALHHRRPPRSLGRTDLRLPRTLRRKTRLTPTPRRIPGNTMNHHKPATMVAPSSADPVEVERAGLLGAASSCARASSMRGYCQ